MEVQLVTVVKLLIAVAPELYELKRNPPQFVVN
jgi:hypothetical protein